MLKFRSRRSYFLKRSIIPGALGATILAILCLTLAAGCIAVLIMPVYRVSGCSMEPTLHDGDLVLLKNVRDIALGDICCFKNGDRVYVKRVIALAGSSVDMDEGGKVSVNSAVLRENYVTELSCGTVEREFPCTVPENSCFVLGDNREKSLDSRSNAVGFVPVEDIIGKVVYVVRTHSAEN